MTNTELETDKKEQVDTLNDVATAGAILKTAREKKSMTIEAVALQLHLRPKVIADIEADIYDNISSATYARGYVKIYARFVGADINAINISLVKLLPEEVEPAMISFSRKTSRQARDSRLNLVTYFVITVLIALVVLWWVQKSSSLTDVDFSKPTIEEIAAESAIVDLSTRIENEAKSNEANHQKDGQVSEQTLAELTAAAQAALTETGTATTPASSGLVQPGNVAATENNGVAVTAELTPSTSESAQSATAPAATSSQPPLTPATDNATPAVDAAPQAVAPEADLVVTGNESLIKLELSGDCWINIVDANGKVLVDGVRTAGRQVQAKGISPFKVILGAPQVVTLTLNGEKISLAEFTDGRVARMTLPKA